MQKSATGVARRGLGGRETIGSVVARALTGDSVEMEFLTGGPVAQAVTCQRVRERSAQQYDKRP
jgi:hypothetical protein